MSETWNEDQPVEVARERAKFDPFDIAHYISMFARTFEARIKIEEIARELYGIDKVIHGSATDVALRTILKDIVLETGEPIGSKGGRNGGYWYMVTEADREPSLAPLRSLEASITRRRQAIETVKLKG